MGDNILLLEKLAIIVLAVVTFKRQYKQFAVKGDISLKRKLLFMSVGFLSYGLLTSISVSFRIFSQPLTQGTTTLIGNISSLAVFLTMGLFYLIYESK